VEDDIKIRHKYLEAMENEDFGILPGKAYIKGFLKNYAGYLGLDAAEMMSQYLSEYQAEEEHEIEVQEQVSPKGEKKGYRAAAFALAGIVLVAAVYAVLPSFNNEVGVNKPPAIQQRDSENKGEQREPSGTGINNDGNNNNIAAPPEVARNGVDLTLNVTDKTSWMLVVVDGQTQFTGELAAGQSKSFRGQERIWFKLGNAGVVEVQLNGESIGVLGNRGQVVQTEYTADTQG
jgi:hypothetical protein